MIVSVKAGMYMGSVTPLYQNISEKAYEEIDFISYN